MDLLDILFASYQEASAFEDIEENEGKRNKERSQRWVNSLGKQFQGLFPIESGFRVFYLGNDDNKTDFGLNELLFDISVCEVGTVRSAFHESELIFVRGSIWQVESEFSMYQFWRKPVLGQTKLHRDIRQTIYRRLEPSISSGISNPNMVRMVGITSMIPNRSRPNSLPLI